MTETSDAVAVPVPVTTLDQVPRPVLVDRVIELVPASMTPWAASWAVMVICALLQVIPLPE